VSEKTDVYDLLALRALVERNPGCPEFPALAEALRRAGRPGEAKGVSLRGLLQAPSRMSGQVSLGLSLIDLDDIAAARKALAPILDSLLERHRLVNAAEPWPVEDLSDDADTPLATVPEGGETFDAAVDDDEIAAAFETAEADRDQMVSVNDMAEQALLDTAPIDPSGPPSVDEDEPFEIGSSTTYSTTTMANLLEQQGDREGAQTIRQTLDRGASEGATDSLMDAAEVPAAANVAADEAVPDAAAEGERVRVVHTLETWLHNIQRNPAE
jgi:hypothetical protein